MMDPMQSAGPRRRTGARSSQRPAESQGQPTAPDLFSTGLDEGRRLRDDGQRIAEHAAHPWVRTAVDRWITDRLEPFTSDDIRADIEPFASSPNVIGARIAAAARRGEIEFTDHVQSVRPEAHGRYVKLWRKVGGDA